MGILKLPEKPKVVCGFQVPTQLKNIFPAARSCRQRAASPMRGAARKSGAGVLPCCHCLLATPKQSLKPAAEHGQKSTTGTGTGTCLCAHPLPAARVHPTAPATERLGSAVGPESKGGKLLPHFPAAGTLRGDGARPDPWRARGEGGEPQLQPGYRTAGHKVRGRDVAGPLRGKPGNSLLGAEGEGGML